MPRVNGFELLERVRAMPGRCDLPFVFFSAMAATGDVRTGMALGADDYITKPFSVSEMLARIRAVLRRRAPEQAVPNVSVGELTLDGATYRVSYQGEPLKIGPTEFKLLSYLMHHAERVHTRSQLLDKVWGDHVFIEERTVDVHIKRLRESLGKAGVMVETVRGTGYRLTAQVTRTT